MNSHKQKVLLKIDQGRKEFRSKLMFQNVIIKYQERKWHGYNQGIFYIPDWNENMVDIKQVMLDALN